MVRYNICQKLPTENVIIRQKFYFILMIDAIFVILDDDSAPLKYNRRCARSSDEGCQEVNIQTPDGNVYPGRVCFCKEDKCNDVV